jgi:hypothetical protein
MTTKENRGGARKGAGRKPAKSMCEEQVKKMLSTAERYQAKHGKSIDEALLDIVYSHESDMKEKLAAIRIFKNFTMEKLKEETDDGQSAQTGPQFYLPERRPDPAKVVQLKPGNE